MTFDELQAIATGIAQQAPTLGVDGLFVVALMSDGGRGAYFAVGAAVKLSNNWQKADLFRQVANAVMDAERKGDSSAFVEGFKS